MVTAVTATLCVTASAVVIQQPAHAVDAEVTHLTGFVQSGSDLPDDVVSLMRRTGFPVPNEVPRREQVAPPIQPSVVPDTALGPDEARQRLALATGGTNVDADRLRSGLVAGPQVPPAAPSAELAQACKESDAANGGRVGMVWNRWTWCSRYLAYDVRFSEGGALVGFLFAGFDFIGYGRDDGERSVKVFVRPNIVFYGGSSYTPLTPLSVAGGCYRSTLGCSISDATITKPVGQWQLQTGWDSFTLNSDESVSPEQDKVLWHGFYMSTIFFDGARRNTSDYWVRCDSAYLVRLNDRRLKACIFWDIRSNLRYRLYEADGTTPSPVYGVANHIRDAFQHPEITFPTKANKRIPGNFDAPLTNEEHVSNALNRVPYDSPDWRANSATKDAACNRTGDYRETGLPTPPAGDQQCDEYPFATTQQGAAHPYYDFSVRAVDATQNGAAGNDLQAYYFTDRVLYYDLDYFWVKILDK